MNNVEIGDWVIAEAEEGETVESQVAFVVELSDEEDIIVLEYHYVRTRDIIELDKNGGVDQ